VLAGKRIVLTAHEGDKLVTFCLNRDTGRIQWRRDVRRERMDPIHKSNSPASPSPVSDGKNTYVFFQDVGLISYGSKGNERWKLPLGPFKNRNGMAGSPILSGDRVLLVCDQDSDSLMLAVDKDSGKIVWKADRDFAIEGFSTPILYRPGDGSAQVIVSGSYEVAGYSVESGDKIWWLRGLPWQMKTTPVMGEGVLYVHGSKALSERPQQELPPFGTAVRKLDADRNGTISKEEASLDPHLARLWGGTDLEQNGQIDERSGASTSRGWRQKRGCLRSGFPAAAI